MKWQERGDSLRWPSAGGQRLDKEAFKNRVGESKKNVIPRVTNDADLFFPVHYLGV